MTTSSFMSPTKEAPASLSLVDPVSLAMDNRSRNLQKLLHESPRRRRIEETMRVSFLNTLPEEDWERYHSELERKTGVTWSRVTFMERTWDVIRRYGTQYVMKVGLNQPIIREVLDKLMRSIKSDVLTESVTEDTADDQEITINLPVRRARKLPKRLKGKTGSKTVNQKVVKSKASAVVASLARAARPSENGQGDGATLAGGEKENLIPPMLLAGLTTTATRSKKNARTLADTKLEMEVISQCWSGGLDDYKPSRTNMARMKLEGQLDVVEYSRITVPDSAHMGDPAGGYVEMLKARNFARGHLMAWSEKQAVQEYLKELTESSNLNRKGKRSRAWKAAGKLSEGGPPKIFRLDDACTCEGGSIPGSSVYENWLASTVGLVFDGDQEVRIWGQQWLEIKGTGTGIDGAAHRYDPRERLQLLTSAWLSFLFQKCDIYQMSSPRTAIVCWSPIHVCRNSSYKIPQKTEAWWSDWQRVFNWQKILGGKKKSTRQISWNACYP